MSKSNPIKWNYDMVKKYIEENGYILNSKTYVRKRDKLIMTCPNGHIIELSFDCFTKGVRCGECYKKSPRLNRRQSYEDIKRYVESYEGYILLSKEYDPKKKILIQHECGNVYEVTLNNFKRGNRCPICATKRLADSKRIDKKYLKQEVSKKGYKVISFEGFNKSRDKLTLECNKGHVYKSSWDSFRDGFGLCPYCRESKYKGENKIREILELNNISYIEQYRFSDCRNKKPLSFDFYLDDLNICIEYDGEQHYKPIDFGGSYSDDSLNKRFATQKENDKIKTQYCNINSIKLIRIPYWEFENIECILKEFGVIKTFND